MHAVITWYQSVLADGYTSRHRRWVEEVENSKTVMVISKRKGGKKEW